MTPARSLGKSGLLEFLCRPPRESDRDSVLRAAARACLSAPGAHRAWAKLEAHSVRAPDDPDSQRSPYGVEVPVDLAGRVCGTVGLETDEPVGGAAHQRVGAIADLLATWEARRRLLAQSSQTVVGCSAELRHVELLARRYAALEEPVLIQGETGVGKELVAQTLHCVSPRSAETLWTINCAAVPDELIASELFGHRRGAFTGAVRDQRGRFEVADGATLFLDEIGEMGPSLQAALLRVLEYGEIQQLGDEGRMRRINVRVIAASNVDLATEVSAGRFRGDLYYRLTPLTIHVPPLRERPEDIPVLARYFVDVLEERWGQSLDLVSRAIRRLIQYPFPGNARELRNLVLRAAATCCEGRIETIPFPNLARPYDPPSSLEVDRREVGRRIAKGDRRAIEAGKASSPGKARLGGRQPPVSAPGSAKKRSDPSRGGSVETGVGASPGGFGDVLRGSEEAAAGGRGPDAPLESDREAAAFANRPLPLEDDPLTLDWATEAHLRRVLAMAKGNVSRAARMLDIPRTTLQSKLRRYGVY